MVVGNSKVTPKGESAKDTKEIKESSVTNTSSVENKEKSTIDIKKLDPKGDGVLIGKKSRSQTFPFLLNFDIFNQKVHNYLVDSKVSSNVMPYLICKKLNEEIQMRKTKVIQLDQSHVKVLGDLKDVLIHLA